ncbi:MAG: SLC13 family permease [Clostridium sp.]|jgi:Na+/H+ antiporter NhaD/arsenite permease-like protein
MTAQILAVVIFLVMFALIVSEKIERHIVSLGCGLLMVVFVFGVCMHSEAAAAETLSLQSFFIPNFWFQAGEAAETSTGINWATILFIAGMMLMVEGMGRAGFFQWLCLAIAKAVHYRTIPIFVTFMVMSALLAMFIDSITVILFLAAVTVELGKLLRFDPVPLILSEIFYANLGGSATMCGDPPNIIIGTSLGYSFGDFMMNTGVMAGISLVFVILFFYFCFRKELSQKTVGEGEIRYPDPKEAIANKKDFGVSVVIFLTAIVLLITHAQTGLTVATIGVFIGAFTLLAAGSDALMLLKKVDYKTLLFFIGLFIVVGGLEQTGVLEAMAGVISAVSGDNAKVMIAIVLWLSAIASAFVDNIPFAATMIPVIRSLSAAQGVDLSVLAWALSMGTDIGGCGTPIGASANVVGISVAAQNGHFIGWGKYCRYAAPATILVVFISMICIYVRYF